MQQVKVEEGTAPRRRDGVQVIARAAEMLRRLVAEPDGLTLIELAARVELPRSTAHRIVRALTQEGFVRTSHSGKLRIGPSLIGIAVSSRRDLRHEAGPFLERLSRELRETVDLAVLDAGEVLFVDQYVSRRALRVVSEIGSRFPVYCTASGKALLAALQPGEAERLLPKQLKAMTDNTIVSREALLDEIEEARARGVASDRQEHTLGVCAVGCVVHDAGGTAAAISVIMPAARFSGNAETSTSRALLRARDEIQVVLQGD
jgi:DNA-binding IclR family transcriptional regulator